MKITQFQAPMVLGVAFVLCAARSLAQDATPPLSSRPSSEGSLFVHVPADVREPGLDLRLDGNPLPSAQWGTRLRISSGPHVLEARAPAFAPQIVHITVTGADRNDSVTLEPLSAPPPESASSPPAPAGHLLSDARPDRSRQPLRTLSFVVGGAGVVGLGVGTAFGILSAQKKSDADMQCHLNVAGKSLCSAQGVSLGSDAIDAGNVSTGAFVVGAAGMAGAVVLWIVSSRRVAPGSSAWQLAPAIGLSAGTLSLKGTW